VGGVITHAKKSISVVIYGIHPVCVRSNYYLKVTSCKEGLIKPPKRQGKQDNILTNRSKEFNGENRWPGQDILKNKQKPHPILADLENRHASADVEKSLNIKSGQRIRLPSHQADVDYEKHEGHPRLSVTKEQSIHDITNQKDVVRKNDSSLLESDYSDTEVDSIIRAFPIDEDQVEVVETHQDKRCPETPLPAESRKRETPLFREESSPAQKNVEDFNFKPQTATSVHAYDAFQDEVVRMQQDKRSSEMPLLAESRKRKTPLFLGKSLSPEKRIKLGDNSNFKRQATTPVRAYDLSIFDASHFSRILEQNYLWILTLISRS
jgi:hypothetical protein